MSKKPASNAKAPHKAGPKAPPAPQVPETGRYNMTPVAVLARVPHDILAGLDKRVAAGEFKSRNVALVLAVLEFAKYPSKVAAELRAEFLDEPVSLASRVKTEDREPEAPGARLDKSSIGKSAGKPKPPKGGKGKAAPADEVIV